MPRITPFQQPKAVVVFAAPGHGNIPSALNQSVQDLLENGIDVIRATRCPSGCVEEGGELQEGLNANDAAKIYNAGGLSLNQCMVLAALGGVHCLETNGVSN